MSFSKDEIVAINQALKGRVNSYLDLAQRVRTDYSEETIHDFRVASRRLLATEPLLIATSKTDYWRKRSRRWLKALNSLRDLQVMQHRFSSIEAIDKKLSYEIDRELSHFKKVSKKIAAARFRRRLSSSLDDYCAAVEARPKRANKMLFAYWREVSDDTEAHLSQVDYRNIESLHRLRVKYKAFRYLLELLVECKLIDKKQVSNLKHWQDLLGTIHDLQVAQDWLTQIIGTSDLQSKLNNEMQGLSISFQQARPTLQRFADRVDAQVTYRLQIKKSREESTGRNELPAH